MTYLFGNLNVLLYWLNSLLGSKHRIETYYGSTTKSKSLPTPQRHKKFPASILGLYPNLLIPSTEEVSIPLSWSSWSLKKFVPLIEKLTCPFNNNRVAYCSIALESLPMLNLKSFLNGLEIPHRTRNKKLDRHYPIVNVIRFLNTLNFTRLFNKKKLLVPPFQPGGRVNWMNRFMAGTSLKGWSGKVGG